MKKTKFKFIIAAVLVMAFFAAAASYGMNGDKDEKHPTEKQANSLVMGIKSSNEGVSQSSIYYAGQYRIVQSVEVLINILNDPQRDNYTRTLAALSLGRIGDPKGIKAIKEIAEGDKDAKLKTVSNIIYKEYNDFNDFQLSAGK